MGMKPVKQEWLDVALAVIRGEQSIERIAASLRDTRQNIRVKLSGALLSAAIAGQIEIRRKV